MKKRTKIILGVVLSIVAVLLASAVTLVCMNWEIAKGVFSLLKSAPGNNLKAAWIFLTENSDGIENRLNENQEKYGEAVNSILSDLNEQGTGITKEAVEALNSGLYTEDEMIRIITSGGAELEEINRGKQQAETDDGNPNGSETDVSGQKVNSESGTEIGNQTQNPSGTDSGSGANTNTPVSENENNNGNDSKKGQTDTPSGNTNDNNDNNKNNQADTNSGRSEASTPITSTQPQPTQPDDTAASIAKLYIIKSNFVSQLSAIEKSITSAYLALPKEQQTPASRKSIAGEYISTVANLELECDAQVEAILAELKTKLEAASKDTSVAETIRQSYENEKSLKKAYYMDIYMNGLPDKTTSDK